MKVIYNNKEVSSTTYDYDKLLNKPKINSVLLDGNVTLSDIGVYSKSEVDSLVSNNKSIKIVSSLPSSLNKNTKYYVGPLSGTNKYHVYIVDNNSQVIDLGETNQAQYGYGKGISITSDKVINSLYNDISVKKNTENLLYIPITENLNYGRAKPDNNTIIFTSEGEIGVSELSGTKGSNSKPIYLEAGKIKASSGVVGIDNKTPVYINNGTITQFTKTIFDLLYPVGSIYVSATMSTASQVQSAFGGTWVAWGSGRVPIGINTSDTDFNTVEATGGEKTHKLTIDEMPNHLHKIYAYTGGTSTETDWLLEGHSPTKKNYIWRSLNYRGGDQPHNNLMPYITCYMYKRTA